MIFWLNFIKTFIKYVNFYFYYDSGSLCGHNLQVLRSPLRIVSFAKSCIQLNCYSTNSWFSTLLGAEDLEWLMTSKTAGAHTHCLKRIEKAEDSYFRSLYNIDLFERQSKLIAATGQGSPVLTQY